jgi:DNA replication protein DnaC
MPKLTFDPARFRRQQRPSTQYRRQLERLAREGKQVDCIEQAVDGAMTNLSSSGRASFVVYGEPQSGKTEMMICLTARLLDEGRLFVLHLLNDSVDLLGQNLGRFQSSGLAPAAKNFTDIVDPAIQIKGRQHVVFCKKNKMILTSFCRRLVNSPISLSSTTRPTMPPPMPRSISGRGRASTN